MYYLRLLYIAFILFKTHAIILGSIARTPPIAPIEIPNNLKNNSKLNLERQASRPSLSLKNQNSTPSTCFSFLSDSRLNIDGNDFPDTLPVLKPSDTMIVHHGQQSGLPEITPIVNKDKEIKNGLSELNVNNNPANLNFTIEQLEEDDNNYHNKLLEHDVRSESNYKEGTISDDESIESNYETIIKNIELKNQKSTIDIIEVNNGLFEEINKNESFYNKELASTIQTENLLNQQGKVEDKKPGNSRNDLLHISFYIIIVISLGSIIAAIAIKFRKYKKPQKK